MSSTEEVSSTYKHHTTTFPLPNHRTPIGFRSVRDNVIQDVDMVPIVRPVIAKDVLVAIAF